MISERTDGRTDGRGEREEVTADEPLAECGGNTCIKIFERALPPKYRNINECSDRSIGSET